MLDELPPLRALITEYDLQAKKNLGQNFLLDLNITEKIVSFAGPLSDSDVIEIGPGPGGLTRAILKNSPKSLTVFERDERVRPILEQLQNLPNQKLNMYFEDALKANIFENIDENCIIIANLPYNIGTELLVRWLTQKWPPQWQKLILMFQLEVAERITATPNSNHWGRLSVLANYLCDTQIVYRLPASAFTPPPKVNSAVVKLTPKLTNPTIKLKNLEIITASAFGQRRKMLRSALKNLFDNPILALESCDIEPTRRGETLTIEEFVKLTEYFEAQNC